MKHLRHPVRAIREPFGTAGLIVACIALVAALAGGAYAATGLNGKQKKEVKKIAQTEAKKLATAGPQGPAGPQGAKGDAGAPGSPGKDGTPGAAGKSVTATGIPVGEPECEERGGVEVKQEGAASGAEICNGQEGSPWTAGGTLPPGETETGTYLINSETGTGTFEPATRYALAEISFPLPLPSEIQEANVVYVQSTPADANCENPDHSGAASVENPEADPGFLCIYNGQLSNNMDESEMATLQPGSGLGGASVAGTIIAQKVANKDEVARGAGTWAVTAPTGP